MKKYAAFSGSDIVFLRNAALPHKIPEDEDCRFKKLRHCYVPEDFSLINADAAEWMQQYIDSQNKVAAGVVAEKDHVSTLVRALSVDHTFLPLDNNALCFALDNKLPFEVPTDWLTGQQFYAAPRLASNNLRAWLAKYDARDFGWLENWFEFDKFSFFYLMQAATMAESLIPLLAQKASRLVVFCRKTPSVLPTMSATEIPQTIWKTALPDITTAIVYPATPPLEYYLEGVERQDYSIMHDSVTLALYENHFPRHNNIIEATLQQSTRPVTLALLHCRWNSTLSRNSLLGQTPVKDCPTVVIPSFSGTLNDFSAEVLCGFQTSMQGLFPFSECLDFMFKDFATTRFYNLESTYSYLFLLWQKYRPAMCIAENLAYGEQCIPLLVSRALEIPCASVPHGAMHAPSSLEAVPATTHCFCTPLQLNEWKSYVESDAECLCLQEFNMNTSYSSSSSIRYYFPEHKKIILVVLGAAMWFTPLLQNTYMPHMYNWLTEINNPPEDMQEETLIFYKLHPGFTDYGLMKRAGIDEKHVLPKESSLNDLLQHIDILVSCEYISSPSLVGFESNIPVLHCIDKHAISDENNSDSKRLVAKIGKLVTSPEDFWDSVREIHGNSIAREIVLARQQAFLKEFIYPKETGWGACMEAIIAKKHATPSPKLKNG